MEVLGPAPYAQAVKKIGNKMDLARAVEIVDLKDVLTPADIGCVSWKGIGKPLPEEILQKIFDACDRLLALHLDYEKVHAFVGSITEYFVPNLCVVFGSEVASKLMVGTAGVSRH
ncbi:U4/U6 small nuclear ribonucleoprotein Prp31 homolog [Rhododendron vialii]|uniref:U4/U6 small nuclear ribonucleoprotein Prp31 homolog n=1 Tax=Rhododendron vialii TaxID=182163 RepID=UPI00265DFEA3|nr:U4/U6 small nuclear ribonucleoprotein Prp31 homolog [Rhododendron vialii]